MPGRATPEQQPVATAAHSPRPWDWGIRGGGPERAFSVTVGEADAEGLAELVSSTSLEGFMQTPGQPAFIGRDEGWSMQYQSIGVQDGQLWVSSYYTDDEVTRASITGLLGRVALSHLRVLEWRVIENYDGRTWVSGTGNASLSTYLGLEDSVTTGPGWTYGLRGTPEEGVVVRVRAEDATRLAEVVSAHPLEGFVQLPEPLSWMDASAYQAQPPLPPREVELQAHLFDGVSVHGAHLVVVRKHGNDPVARATQDDLLRRVVEDVVVERWSKGERYDGRPWAEGLSGASLREHLTR